MTKQKYFLISFLSVAFVFSASAAFANLNFGSNTITSDGVLNLTPTGQPVAVGGDLSVAGSELSPPVIAATGSDSNISLKLQAKGTGMIQLGPETYGTPTTYYQYVEVVNSYENAPNDEATGMLVDVYSKKRVWGIYTFANIVEDPQPSARAIAITSVASSSNNSGDGTQLLYGVDAGTSNYGSAGVGASVVYGATIINSTGNINDAMGLQVSVDNDGTIDRLFGVKINETGGHSTYGSFPFYADERGVFAIKADNSFNSVYQAIATSYNPQMAKYLIYDGTNYEGLVLGRWNSNVAEIGTTAGGTGTLRALKLLGTQLTVPNHVNSTSANNDFDGLVTVSASTTGAHTFTAAFASAPACTLTPTTDPNAIGRYWVTTSTTAVTANVGISGTISFYYHCIGNPN